MARVKRGVTKHARHKKVTDAAKGYKRRNNNCFRISRQKVQKGLQYAYRDRRQRKRQYRRLWVQRINAAVRQDGLTYAAFMDGLRKAGVEVDRKVLAELAVNEPESFAQLVEQARTARGQA